MKSSLPLILLLVYVLTVARVEAQNQTGGPDVMPTKEQICFYPNFHASLAIIDPVHSHKYHRYLFKDKWMFPYIRDEEREQIDWEKGRLIGEVFPQLSTATGVRMAFHYSINDTIYVMPKDKQEIQYVYSVDQSSDEPKFTYLAQIGWNKVPNEFIFWRFWTKTESETQKFWTSMFVDSSYDAKGMGWAKDFRLDSTKGGGPTVLWVSHNTAMQDMGNRLKLWAMIYPNTMVFVNNINLKFKIPLEFDAHYTTLAAESIYFRGDFACVTHGTFRETSADWEATDYCKTWVNTRTIIGCFDGKVDTTGPEVIPDEPEDIDPDF